MWSFLPKAIQFSKACLWRSEWKNLKSHIHLEIYSFFLPFFPPFFYTGLRRNYVSRNYHERACRKNPIHLFIYFTSVELHVYRGSFFPDLILLFWSLGDLQKESLDLFSLCFTGILFWLSFYYYLKTLEVPAAVWSHNNRQALISHAWYPAWCIREKAPNLLLNSNNRVCHFVGDQNPVQILQSLTEQQAPNDKTYQKKESKKAHLCFRSSQLQYWQEKCQGFQNKAS